MKVKWITNEIVKPIIIVIIGSIFSLILSGIAVPLYLFYEFYEVPPFGSLFYLGKGVDFNNIPAAEAEKFLGRIKMTLVIFMFLIIPFVSIIPGIVVGLLSNKKAWLLGGIASSPYIITYFISTVSKEVSFNLLTIEMIFCFCLIPPFFSSLSSHLTYKLKMRFISKIKRRKINEKIIKE